MLTHFVMQRPDGRTESVVQSQVKSPKIFDRISTFVFWDEQEWPVFVGCWLVYGCQPRYSEMPLKEVEGG